GRYINDSGYHSSIQVQWHQLTIAHKVLKDIAKPPEPKHIADESKDVRLGEHITQDSPGTGQQLVKAGRKSKPGEDLTDKKLRTSGIQIVDEMDEFQDDEEHRIDHDELHQRIPILPKRHPFSIAIFHYSHTN